MAAASVLAGCALVVTHALPEAAAGAEWLARGPHRVATTPIVFVDRARDRTLAATLWWPADAAGPAPLVVQSHGFLAHRNGLGYVARHLASRGYVVVAATHPHTSTFARGGARLDDVARQPGDVRFLIDRLLGGVGALPRLPAIDPDRIAVMGHSLGGLTATLTAFHPRIRDPRVAAAIAIAGPMAIFEPSFFRGAGVPFLMIAGDADVIVDYERNATATLDLVPGSTLVTLAGASHAAFHEALAWLPRFGRNPDVLGCWILRRTLHLDTAVTRVGELVQSTDGIDLGRARAPCTDPPPSTAMSGSRQRTLTMLASTAFLESRFAATAAARERARRYLTTTLPREAADVRVQTAPR